MPPPTAPHAQSGVIPYRWRAQQLEILLITSRRRSRWIIPKGIVELNLSPAASAEKEAFEEVGIRGVGATPALGAYEYEKWGYRWTVTVFPFAVTEILATWPEMLSRERRWYMLSDAAALVDEPELRALLKRLAARMAAPPPGK